MNTTSPATSFISKNSMFLVLFFVVFLLSSSRTFGQTAVATAEVCDTVAVSVVTESAVAFESDVDFVNWFMGSKQTQNISKSSETSTTISRKKQIISSGVTPNKVLYRTFMKRVISQEIAIA